MARATGLGFHIEGIEQLVKGLERGADELDEAMRDILRGPVGGDLLRELRARLSDHRKTGRTLANTRGEDTPEGTRVGVIGDRQHIGTWLESGTRMHIIAPTNARALQLGSGRIVEEAVHPGTRATRIMAQTMRVMRDDIESTLVRELDRRLGRIMETDAA